MHTQLKYWITNILPTLSSNISEYSCVVAVIIKFIFKTDSLQFETLTLIEEGVSLLFFFSHKRFYRWTFI